MFIVLSILAKPHMNKRRLKVKIKLLQVVEMVTKDMTQNVASDSLVLHLCSSPETPITKANRNQSRTVALETQPRLSGLHVSSGTRPEKCPKSDLVCLFWRSQVKASGSQGGQVIVLGLSTQSLVEPSAGVLLPI